MSNWASDRARFNHDRLKNQFTQSVLRVIRALQGATADEQFVDEFITRLPQTWEPLQYDAQALLESAERQIGPTAWFQSWPLNRLDRDDRQWMEFVLGRAWREHSGVRNALDAARAAVEAVTEQCQTLRHAYLLQPAGINRSRPAATGSGAETLAAAMTLHARCVHLADVFSRFSADDPIQALAIIDRGHKG